MYGTFVNDCLPSAMSTNVLLITPESRILDGFYVSSSHVLFRINLLTCSRRSVSLRVYRWAVRVCISISRSLWTEILIRKMRTRLQSNLIPSAIGSTIDRRHRVASPWHTKGCSWEWLDPRNSLFEKCYSNSDITLHLGKLGTACQAVRPVTIKRNPHITSPVSGSFVGII